METIMKKLFLATSVLATAVASAYVIAETQSLPQDTIDTLQVIELEQNDKGENVLYTSTKVVSKSNPDLHVADIVVSSEAAVEKDGNMVQKVDVIYEGRGFAIPQVRSCTITLPEGTAEGPTCKGDYPVPQYVIDFYGEDHVAVQATRDGYIEWDEATQPTKADFVGHTVAADLISAEILAKFGLVRDDLITVVETPTEPEDPVDPPVDPVDPEALSIRIGKAADWGIVIYDATMEEATAFFNALEEQHGAKSAWGMLGTDSIMEHWAGGKVAGYVYGVYDMTKAMACVDQTAGYTPTYEEGIEIDAAACVAPATGGGGDTGNTGGGDTGGGDNGNDPVNPDDLSETEIEVEAGLLIDLSKPQSFEFGGNEYTYYDAYYADGAASPEFDGLTTWDELMKVIPGQGEMIGYIQVDGSGTRSGHYRTNNMAFGEKHFWSGELSGQKVNYKYPDIDIAKNMQIAGAPANYNHNSDELLGN